VELDQFVQFHSFEYSLDFSPVNNRGDLCFPSFALLTASAHNKFLASSSKLATHLCMGSLNHSQSSFNNTILLWYLAVFSNVTLALQSVLQIGFLLLDHILD
jgi:hypothetical protein